MTTWLNLCVTAMLLLLLPSNVDAARKNYQQVPVVVDQMLCMPVYSQRSIPFSYQSPRISVVTDHIAKGDQVLVVIWRQDHNELLGLDEHKNPIEGQQPKYCDKEQCGKCVLKGELIVDCEKATDDVFFQQLLPGPRFKAFPVKTKSLYCAEVISINNANFTGTWHWEYPYGTLPAVEYPYLPFYGFMALAYLVVGCIWAVLTACYFREILQVQIYISGIIFLCMVEMAVYFGYYHNYNMRGEPSTALHTFAVILNAGRDSASFVALLVVCMGYGLVKPTLGSTANKVLALGFAHFVFNTLYLLYQNQATDLVLATAFVFPLAVTLTTFYFWTFKSLTETMKRLELRRQTSKIFAYKWLYRILVASFIVLFVLLAITIVQTADPEKYWDSIWLKEASFQLLYFVVFLCIIFLWRPRKNNSRYGVEEVPQFDMDDIEAEAVVGGVSDKITKRKKVRADSKEDGDDPDDDLRWVEENLPDTVDDADDDVPTADLDETALEARLLREELSKMN